MTNTAIHFEVKIRDLIILIIGILTILTFYPHLFTGIGKTRDDTQAALVALSNVDHFKVALDREKGFGRLRLGHYIENLSYLIDSPFYYKLFHIGPLVLNLLLFLYVLNMFYRSYALIGFFSIIYLASLQNSWEHNLLSCYPFLFTFSFNILLISVILFKKYLDTSMKSYLIISAGLFFLPLFTYEMFLLYFVIFIILAFIYGGSVSLPVENRLVRVIYILRPFLLYIAIFVIAYFVFRRLYQVNYDGVQIAKFTIRNFFGVVYQFSVSALPTYVFFHYQWLFDHYTDALEGHRYNLFYIVQNSRVEWMAKAALSAYFIYILAKAKQRVLDFRKFGATILISVALIFLPTLLFAITVKYQAWVQS
ncbi:MAG: hypothetical protein HY232_03400 [Acidobacteria bacterium]|nr:hypothetical protein [Acidobacteriota bacterium]